jgi:hypothetical protein
MSLGKRVIYNERAGPASACARMENKLLLIRGLLNSDTFSIFRVNFLSFHGSDTGFTTRRRYNYSLFARAAAQYFLTLLLAVPLYTLITLYIY